MNSKTAGHQLGEVIRQARERAGISVRSLATETGFSPSFISQLENGLASPSIGSLEKIAAHLDLSLSELFERREAEGSQVVRSKDRQRIDSNWSRARIEDLRSGKLSHLEPLLITIQPGGSSSKLPQASEREQFVFVVEGNVQCRLDEEEQELGTGDAVTIRKGHKVRWRNESGEPVTLLLVGHRSQIR